jgi:miniconductance mechanosensitive channel
LEPVPEGVPLQVYTYITKTSVVPYELVQSSIMEHMFMSMEWFGLRIYQKPSSSDVSEISSDFVKYNLSDD